MLNLTLQYLETEKHLKAHLEGIGHIHYGTYKSECCRSKYVDMKNIHNQLLSFYGMVFVCVCEKERENVHVGIYVVETLEIHVSEHWLQSGSTNLIN